MASPSLQTILEMGTLGILALLLGSFASAVSYRLPRNIAIGGRARSFCPLCKHALGFFDLIPLFSWLSFQGKCRHCNGKISLRYPTIELITLALTILIYYFYGLSFTTALVFLLPPLLITIMMIDVEHKIIPDILNLAFLMLGVMVFILNAYLSPSFLFFIQQYAPAALLGVLIYGGGAYLLRAAVSRWKGQEAMGLGDIKFLAAAGFWLGSGIETLALFLILAGLIGVIFSLLWKKILGEDEAPFAPALIVSFIVVTIFHIQKFIQI